MEVLRYPTHRYMSLVCCIFWCGCCTCVIWLVMVQIHSASVPPYSLIWSNPPYVKSEKHFSYPECHHLLDQCLLVRFPRWSESFCPPPCFHVGVVHHYSQTYECLPVILLVHIYCLIFVLYTIILIGTSRLSLWRYLKTIAKPELPFLLILSNIPSIPYSLMVLPATSTASTLHPPSYIYSCFPYVPHSSALSLICLPVFSLLTPCRQSWLFCWNM